MLVYNNRRMKKIISIIGIMLSVIILPVKADTLTVGCAMQENNFSDAFILFSGITSETFDQNDYGETGTLTLTAKVNGNGNTAKFTQQSSYKKVGNRLETKQVWLTLTVTMEEFKAHFGLFPELTCSSP